jgi:TonB family protein
MNIAMDTADIRAEWIGQVIDGRFPLHQWIGGSEPSAVFLTTLQGPGSKKAAVKLVTINREISRDAGRGADRVADGFNAERRIAGWARSASLSHPHLVRLLQTGRCQIDGAELLYVVMDYAEEVLSEILPVRPLTPDETIEMLGPVIEALTYLHGKGFVHGHLKPANILDVEDRLKISADRLYVSGQAAMDFSPTSVYDAPELATQPISPAADVWSLGVTLVEVLTQQLPEWNNEGNADPVVPESVPEPFAEIARECLRRDPARRCTLDAVKTHLEDFKNIKPTKSIGAVELFAEPEKKNLDPLVARRSAKTQDSENTGGKPGRVGVMLIVAAVVLVVIVAGLFLRSRPAPDSGMQPEARATSRPSPKPAASGPSTRTQTARRPAGNASVVRQVLPDVPEFASRTIQGKVNVEVRLTADRNGDVSDAALASPGPSKYFAKLALEAARKWKFKPARAGGQPVSSEWTLRFRFTRGDVTVTPTEVSP